MAAVAASQSSRVSVLQLEKLLDFLESHEDLALGHCRSNEGRQRNKRLWSEVAGILNSMGDGAIKDGAGWSKYWTIFKNRLKNKIRTDRTARHQTGAGPSNVVFTPLEERARAIIGSDAGAPLRGVQVDPLGAQESEVVQEEIVPVEIIEEVNILDTPTPPSPTLIAQVDSSVACLWLLTPLSAGTAVVAVLIAVSTNNWLHTEENMLNPAYNGTGRHTLVAKHTVSGLWRICHTDPGGLVYRCLDIPYFPLSQYAPDPSDSTNAIPYVVTRSAAPLLLAVFTQAVAALCCVLGHCVKGRRLCTFIAGVLFIISGLIMLTGIVMYISVFKSQVGHKLRYMTIFDTPRMSYSYGYSFGLYISGFIAVELAGTSAIFLFLQWYQKDWITELSEKAKADCRAWDREYAFSDFRERDSNLLERRMMKRDTYPPPGSSAATPRERRRFVFDGDDDVPHCSIHKNRRINLSSASLKDLSSSTLYGFPAAPRPTACDNYFEEFKEVPQSANTLSGLRSASIFQSQASVASGRFLDSSAVEPPPSREEELVTFGAGARGGTDEQHPPRHDRAVGTDPYRRTTPV